MILSERTLSRRKLMIGAAGVATALALASSAPGEPAAGHGRFTPLANTVALDFVAGNSSPGHIRTSYLEALARVKRLLGPDHYITLPRLVWEFGPRVFTEAKFKKEVMVRYPEYGLVTGGMLSFASHGASVLACHERFAHTFGYYPLPLAIPIQDGLEVVDLAYRDNLGNPAVLMQLSIGCVVEQLYDLPERQIVNLSLQVGKFAVIHKRRNVYLAYADVHEQLQAALLTYYQEQNPEDGRSRYYFYDPALYVYQEADGGGKLVSQASGDGGAVGADAYIVVPEEELEGFTTARKRELLQQSLHLRELDISPFVEIRGAYTGEFGVDNIQLLFRLVNTFPEKLFIVAAGNYGDDLRPLRAQFADRWPENLLIVGYWDPAKLYPLMYDTYTILGADLYVDSSDYSPHAGSSMATAVISSAASLLAASGYGLAEIKTMLLHSCAEASIETKPYIPIGSTNIEDYIYAELQHTAETVRVFAVPVFQQNLGELMVRV